MDTDSDVGIVCNICAGVGAFIGFWIGFFTPESMEWNIIRCFWGFGYALIGGLIGYAAVFIFLFGIVAVIAVLALAVVSIPVGFYLCMIGEMMGDFFQFIGDKS